MNPQLITAACLLCASVTSYHASENPTNTNEVKNMSMIDLQSISVTASDWEQKSKGGWRDFPPTLTIDGDLSKNSSWRAEGHGQWIQYDFKKTLDLSTIQIAFVNGDKRQYTIEVHVSATGKKEDWQTVVKKRQNIKGSKELESYTFAQSAQNIQFVRINGYGNDSEKFPEWINITGVAFPKATEATTAHKKSESTDSKQEK